MYLTVVAASIIGNPSPTAIADAASATLIAYGIMGVGAAITLVSRIWEVVDTFGAVDRLTQAGKVAALTPTLEVKPNGMALGLSYSL